MDFSRNSSRSIVLAAVVGLATWSIGCAEKPQSSSTDVESGSGVRPGVAVPDRERDPAAETMQPGSTAPAKDPQGPALLPMPETTPAGGAASEEDTTPLDFD